MKKILIVVLMLMLVTVPALADTKNGNTSQNTFQRWRFTAPTTGIRAGFVCTIFVRTEGRRSDSLSNEYAKLH